MGQQLDDQICEEAARRIYEAQQARLNDRTCLCANRNWRSVDVPSEFWESYIEDARAALSVMSISIVECGTPIDDLSRQVN